MERWLSPQAFCRELNFPVATAGRLRVHPWSNLGGHSPLVGEQVKLPVELAHCDGLGVEHIVVDSFIHTATNGWLPFQRRHGSRQDSVALWSHHQKVNLLASQRAGRQRPMGYRQRLLPLLETPSQAFCLRYSCQSLWAQQA